MREEMGPLMSQALRIGTPPPPDPQGSRRTHPIVMWNKLSLAAVLRQGWRDGADGLGGDQDRA